MSDVGLAVDERDLLGVAKVDPDEIPTDGHVIGSGHFRAHEAQAASVGVDDLVLVVVDLRLVMHHDVSRGALRRHLLDLVDAHAWRRRVRRGRVAVTHSLS